MKTTSLTVKLPAGAKAFIDALIAECEYTSADDCIQKLVEQAAKKRARQERIDELLLEGLDSGDPIDVTPEFWERIHRRFRERHSNKARRR